ncbi:MAG: radical SAM protein [Syntrophorhabdaceae bacterium]|nr:radical SAM protein [Syntrophorhabdaceae bacterium]
MNRLKGERGYCGVGDEALIAYYGPHNGEEPPISGINGSGNIFFSSCNLRCLFCQNYQISRERKGNALPAKKLTEIFFQLQQAGCHNINLVSPTPYAPLIALAVSEAKRQGIGIPFVYNTNAYENVETLELLDGLVDIYLPDFKYWSPKIAARLSDAPASQGYPHFARLAIMEMKRQVGNLVIQGGLAAKGLLMRHLVLPGGLAGSENIIRWAKDTLGADTHISLMSQYWPLHEVHAYPLLQRRVRQSEYDRLIALLSDNGFENVFIQELDSAPLFVPDFQKPEPFIAESGKPVSRES